MCNGDCVWSYSSGLCTPYPIINPAKLPEFVTLKSVVGYDHHFLKNKNEDDNVAKSAIRKIITDANIRLGHPNLKPGVKLEAREIYSVNGNVTLRDNGGGKSMQESLKRESVIKRAPFVLITGIGRMSGKATVSKVCSPHEEAWAISSCDTSYGRDLVMLFI